jgi:hypothetical protein
VTIKLRVKAKLKVLEGILPPYQITIIDMWPSYRGATNTGFTVVIYYFPFK